MTCCSFDASTKIHYYVHPSDLHLIRFARFGLPLDFSGGFAQVVTASLHAPDGDGIEHYPGSLLFEPLPSCDLVSHWTVQV